MSNKTNPLIMVFYLPHHLFRDHESHFKIQEDIAESLKDVDCIHYLLPTDGEAKIECLNPVIVSEEEYAETQSLLDRLKEEFTDY